MTEYKYYFPDSIPLDMIFYKKEYNKIRRLKLMLFSDILEKNEEFKNINRNEKTDILKHIETSCVRESLNISSKNNIFNSWNNDEFLNVYHSICFSISSVLDQSNEDSKNLIERIIKKEIDINNIAGFPLDILCPKKYKEKIHFLEKRANIEIKLKSSKLYYCKKCKQNQCLLERSYNRSLDEGVNLTITCSNCFYSWNG